MWWLVLLILLAGCRQAPATTVSAVDRYDVNIELAPDGSTLVRESIAVRVDAGAAGHVRRVIAGDRSDGFEDAVATIDGSNAGTEIGSGSSLDIAWNLAAGSARSAAIEAQYRAIGVVEIQGMRGTLTWPSSPRAGRTTSARRPSP